MLNPFPVQFLSLFAYLILRVFVGGILFFLGFSHIRAKETLAHAFPVRCFPSWDFSVWFFAFFEIVSGLMFIAGLYTQIAAIIGMVIALLVLLFYRPAGDTTFPGRIFYLLLFAASLSLFITGAGAFAFDLPI
jgi:uncharacterized membrane protein YphA (DoxX/SURF4 family)